MKAAAFSLIALTLNVSGPRRVHQGWPTRREAITTRLKTEAVDTAAFQELWRGEDTEVLAEAAGHDHRVHDASLGLAVTSRWPIESSRMRDFGGGYGALRARLRAGGSSVDVYSTHLEPGEGPSAARRLGQLFRLAEFVRSESLARPFLLLGDLGTSPDERETALFLDLLEARDLCAQHGDEVCGRTLGDRRVDYALIPYSPRSPRESARATFTDLLPDDEDSPSALHFGLRVRLDSTFLRLKPAAKPEGRSEALAEAARIFERARMDAEHRMVETGWIPFLGTKEALSSEAEIAGFHQLEEEARSAQIRATR